MLSMPRIVRPDPHRFWRPRNLGPPLDRPLADPLSETKNCRNLLTGRRASQVSYSLPAHLERFIGDEAIPDTRLGLNETWTCRIAFNLLTKVGDINAEILAAVFFRFRPQISPFHFSAPNIAKSLLFSALHAVPGRARAREDRQTANRLRMDDSKSQHHQLFGSARRRHSRSAPQRS